MLKQRIITALLMLAILLPSIFYPAPEAFGVVALVLVSAGAWEWARLNQCGPTVALAAGGLCAGFCAVSWYVGLLGHPLHLLWTLSGSAWVVLGAWLLYVGVNAWVKVPKAFRMVGGILALWVAWLAVTKARMMGINFLFSILVLVWVADIFAYFAGRSLGGRFFHRKLAPSISPGKTWEGVCGGMVGVVLCAFVWRSLDGAAISDQSSLYSRLGAMGSAFMVLAVLFLATMSVVGDLVESLFKRSASVKDSSGLLPGHGGVLDRVDALLPILPLAMMLSTL
jgi:phosphatidate cytidylyltransferase